MTDDQLNADCPHGCGRTVGEHSVHLSADDCLWLSDALSVDYDLAQWRQTHGMWSADQFEAYRVHHPYSADKYHFIRAGTELARLATLLAGAIVNRKHGVPHSTNLPVQARNRRGNVTFTAPVEVPA